MTKITTAASTLNRQAINQIIISLPAGSKKTLNNNLYHPAAFKACHKDLEVQKYKTERRSSSTVKQTVPDTSRWSNWQAGGRK